MPRQEHDNRYKELLTVLQACCTKWSLLINSTVTLPATMSTADKQLFCQRQAYTILNKVLFIWLCRRQKLLVSFLQEPLLPLRYSLPELMKLIFKYNNSTEQQFMPTKGNTSDNGASELKVELDTVCREQIGQQLNELYTQLAELTAGLSGKRLLGDVYEGLLEQKKRKKLGQFYTPTVAINYILAKTLANCDVVSEPCVRVLDPACGSGHFLLAAYELLQAKFIRALPELRQRYAQERYLLQTVAGTKVIRGQEYWQAENIHYHLLQNCLFGADCDEFAVQLTIINLLLIQPGDLPCCINIITCDSLLGIDSKKNADFWQRQYDYIIGNPPYLSFGLKGQGQMEKEQALYLRQKYAHSAEYKISYYALFFELAINCLQAGGWLGFITPDSFLLGRYFSKLRHFLLENCHIRQLTMLNKSFFKGATVGIPVISILQKRRMKIGLDSKDNNVNIKVPVTESSLAQEVTVTYLLQQTEKSHQYTEACFWQQPYWRFRLYFQSLDKIIVEKMESSTEQEKCLLGQLAVITTGMRGLHGQHLLQSSTKLGESWQQGLVSSAQVIPFQVKYKGDWLNVEPTQLYKGGWEQNIVSQSKILLRQTGDSLVAAIDHHGYYHLNNLHTLSLRTKNRQIAVTCLPNKDNKICPNVSLEYLCCLCNSRLLNYYYHKISLEKGRSMAQTDIETLEKLPISWDWQKAVKLDSLGKKIMEIMAQSTKQKESENQQKQHDYIVSKLMTEIDQQVYQLYRLTAAEIAQVEAEEAPITYKYSHQKAKSKL